MYAILKYLRHTFLLPSTKKPKKLLLYRPSLLTTRLPALLHKSTISQVGLNDNVVNGRHDEFDLRCVRCASKVCIDLFLVGLVEGYEAV